MTRPDSDSAAAIERCDLFIGVPRPAIERLAANARSMFVRQHEPVFRTGDTASGVYVLEQGLVVIGLELPDARHAVTALHGPGRAFGWWSLLGGPSRSVSAFALTDCTAWSIPVGVIHDLMDTDPQSAIVLYKNMAQRALRTVFTLAGQMRASVGKEERIERCPMMGERSFFEWRISGAMVEV
ncbi:MAG: Crp/Fnr family transcriptional regulator, partial [Chloroflexi bacterium]|nr:Crp/Fnr family transcriptional regulator [Chloroflexota bacterium]